MSASSLTCAEFRLASGDLAGAEDRALPTDFAAHARSCASCRTEFAADRRAWRALAAVWATDDPPALLIPAAQASDRRLLMRLRPWLAVAAAAVLIVTVVPLLREGDGREAPRTPTSAAPPQVRTIESGAATFEARGRWLHVETPLGVVRAESARFDVSINQVSPQSLGAQSMNRAPALISVTVAVTAGVIWWAAGSGHEQRLEAPASVRSEALVENDAAARSTTPPTTRPSSGPTIAVRPFQAGADDPVTTASTPDSRPQATLTVVDDERRPVVEATVVVFRGEEILASAKSDAAGRALAPAIGGDADVLVAGGGVPPFVASARLESSGATLTAPGGAVVGGRFLLDGRAPPATLAFTLSTDHPYAVASHLPEAVRRAVDRLELSLATIAARSDADGRFRIGGLPADWAGALTIGREYTLESGTGRSSEMRLPASASDLTINLKRSPGITGRVVEAGTKAVVPLPRIGASMLTRSSASTGTNTGGKDGRFVVYTADPSLREVTLDIAGSDGHGAREVKITTGLDTWQDLGDIELSVSRRAAFIVHDPTGHPIAGAVASSGGNPGTRSTATAPDGRGEITLSGAQTEFTVAALGYAATDVRVPEGSTTPIDVTIEPSNLLTITVLTPEGTVPPGVQVRVHSTEAAFRGGSDFPGDAHCAAGATGIASGVSSISSSGPNDVMFFMHPDATGAVRLTDLKPGTRLEIHAVDIIGGKLDAAEVTMEGTGERRVALVVRRRPRSVHGWVRDEAGRPLANAQVAISTEPSLVNAEETAADGRFTMKNIYADTATLGIRKAGYASITRQDWKLPAGDEDVTFVLPAGRTVLLTVVNDAGRPQPRVELSVALPDGADATSFDLRGMRGDTSDNGTIEFRDLPLGAVTFHADYAGRRYTLAHQTAQPTARITVPAAGAVEAHWGFALPADQFVHLTLTPISAGGEAITQWVSGTSPGEARTMSVGAVLPGTYQVVLEGDAIKPPRDTHRISHPETIEVRAGATTSVTLVQ